MRSSFASQRGVSLVKSPSARQQANRRRLAVGGAMAALALASALIGTLTHPSSEVVGEPSTGPFSYFPAG